MKKTTITIVMAMLCPKRLKAYLQVTLLLCLFSSALMAQEIRPLKIGDKLPDTFWQQEHSFYANGQITKQNLSAYKGKLLILDFWATWCGTCVGKFPITDTLQKENSELKILLISSSKKDNTPAVQQFFATNANAKAHPMSTIVGDTLLKTMFPHKVVPHYVFIDHRGMVMGFGSYHFLNRDMIASLVQQHQNATSNQHYEN